MATVCRTQRDRAHQAVREAGVGGAVNQRHAQLPLPAAAVRNPPSAGQVVGHGAWECGVWGQGGGGAGGGGIEEYVQNVKEMREPK